MSHLVKVQLNLTKFPQSITRQCDSWKDGHCWRASAGAPGWQEPPHYIHHKHLHHTLPPHMTHPVKVSNCCATAGTKDACDCLHKKSKQTDANSVGFCMGFFVVVFVLRFRFKNKYQSKLLSHILHLHPLQLWNLEMTYVYMGKGGSKWVSNNWHLKTKKTNQNQNWSCMLCSIIRQNYCHFNGEEKLTRLLAH